MIGELFKVLVDVGAELVKKHGEASAAEQIHLEEQMLSALTLMRGDKATTASAHDERLEAVLKAISDAKLDIAKPEGTPTP